jgi:putative FmdB family regulatory protein
MPIYEYQCDACGQQFEKLTSYAKADKMSCVHCASEKTRRLLSKFGVSAGSKPADCPMSPAMTRSGGHSCGAGACSHCA